MGKNIHLLSGFWLGSPKDRRQDYFIFLLARFKRAAPSVAKCIKRNPCWQIGSLNISWNYHNAMFWNGGFLQGAQRPHLQAWVGSCFCLKVKPNQPQKPSRFSEMPMNTSRMMGNSEASPRWILFYALDLNPLSRECLLGSQRILGDQPWQRSRRKPLFTQLQ